MWASGGSLLYATYSLCKLRAVCLDHNCEVYKGVQKVRNNTFLTSSEHMKTPAYDLYCEYCICSADGMISESRVLHCHCGVR